MASTRHENAPSSDRRTVTYDLREGEFGSVTMHILLALPNLANWLHTIIQVINTSADSSCPALIQNDQPISFRIFALLNAWFKLIRNEKDQNNEE